nr:hypothetical protein [uncultured Deefgea sp.]
MNLVPIGAQLPTALTRRCDIVASTLATVEQQEIMQFFRDFPELFYYCVQRHYPLTEEQVTRYPDFWDWSLLSKNRDLMRSYDLVEQHAGKLNLGWLSWNGLLPWSGDLIERYAGQWDWRALSWNGELPWSDDLIERYVCQWDWRALSRNGALPWSDDLIERYVCQWDWRALSGNEALPWSVDLLGRYVDRWDWGYLSRNTALPWSSDLVECYALRWNWEELSFNHALPWSIEMIEHFSAQWDWENLSLNHSLLWSCELLERFADQWDWITISFNRAAPWTLELTKRYANTSNWQGRGVNGFLPWSPDLIERYADRYDWETLSWHVILPWSIDLIEYYSDRWDWGSLSWNDGVIWSYELIERFSDRWAWPILSQCHSLPWSNELIERYAQRWRWLDLSLNSRLPWSRALYRKFSMKFDTLAVSTIEDFGIQSLLPQQINQLLTENLGRQSKFKPENNKPLVHDQVMDSEFECSKTADVTAQNLSAEYYSKKNLVSADRANEISAQLNNTNSGIDLEMMQDGIVLAGYHIEKGARTFAAYAEAMIGDLGEAVKPYLKSWYMSVKYDPRAAGIEGLSSAAEVEAADIDALATPEDHEAELANDTLDDVHADSTDDVKASSAALGQVKIDLVNALYHRDNIFLHERKANISPELSDLEQRYETTKGKFELDTKGVRNASELLPALSKVIGLLMEQGLRSFAEVVQTTYSLLVRNGLDTNLLAQVSDQRWAAAYNGVAEDYQGTEGLDDVWKQSAKAIIKSMQSVVPGASSYLTSEQEKAIMPILVRVLDVAFRLGYYKFKDAAKFILDEIRGAISAEVADAITLDNLQGAYIAMSTRYENADSAEEVIAVKSVDEINAHTLIDLHAPTYEAHESELADNPVDDVVEAESR